MNAFLISNKNQLFGTREKRIPRKAKKKLKAQGIEPNPLRAFELILQTHE